MPFKKKLSVAQIHWGFPPTIGGVETHLALMLPCMVRMGHEVSLLTGAVEGMPIEDDYKGVKISRNVLMDLNWLYRRGVGSLEKEVRGMLGNFIEGAKPDIIHAHNMHYFRRVHTLTLADEARRRGIPLILTAHNVWDDALFLELTRDVDWGHIIAVSNYIRSELIGIGCRPDHVTTVHHGIDTDSFKPGIDPAKIYKKYPKLNGKRVVFHPARIGLAKGCDLSIKALNIVRQEVPNTLLMMAGFKNIIDWGDNQTSDVAYFIDLVNHFNLQDNVIIDSYPLEDMPYIYNLCDIVVYPSTAQEPFGMTMLEAMACKKPMIVTSAGGMPEIVKDGVNGFVIPIKDFGRLALRITELLSNPELGVRFGEKGFDMVRERYTAEHVTKATFAIYQRLLG